VASALAAAGARAVLACRNDERAAAAQAELLRRHPSALVETLRLDLGDLAQIASAAAEARERFGPIHVCVNNAGMIARSRTETVDGFETTFAVNHLGHFAWTAHLLPALLEAPASRVVTVSSLAHLQTSMDWDDLMGARAFKPVTAYRRSKLANLLHSAELQRRLAGSSVAGAADTVAVASHPGIVASPFWENAAGPRLRWAAKAFDAAIRLVFSNAAQGAVPVVHAAAAESIEPGRCYGPRVAQRWGRPGVVHVLPEAEDPEAGRRLWARSEELTGVTVAL
jgi:NAD(P)-dependent dehydrogenase (short-subunit alcohol dehydrogenase family)